MRAMRFMSFMRFMPRVVAATARRMRPTPNLHTDPKTDVQRLQQLKLYHIAYSYSRHHTIYILDKNLIKISFKEEKKKKEIS